MRAPILLLALLLITACAPPMREEAVAEPMVVEEASGLGSATDCRPGDDDGIGGTGCRAD
jgi:hypothetical protein